MSLSSPLLEVRGLERSFGSLKAVDKVSFEVERGKIYGFIGPNGAGKTTTMRILATLDRPDSGDAFVDGMSVLVEPRGVRERVGFMADQFQPYPNLDVLQYLDFFARASGLRGRARIRTVQSVASFCGLDSFSSRPATGLSKGMGQRLHLAKTMLHDPSLLILDEPAAGLDPRARIEFRELLRLLAEAGKSILISSHILAELSETCDGVLVIEKGALVVSGSIDEVAKSVKEHSTFVVRVISDLEAAERFFLTQPHISELEIIEGRLEFDFSGGDQEAADLLRRAVGAGLEVVEFVVRAADLEDIFMHTTRGKLQ